MADFKGRFLVLDAYDEAGQSALEDINMTPAGTLYKNMLLRFMPAADIETVSISCAEAARFTPSDYHGVCWTGSNLSLSSPTVAAIDIVQRQLDLVQYFFATGTPQFGSCWAAQLVAVAAGGSCIANPKGREFGVARDIALSDSGREHFLYQDKAATFNGFTSHSEIVGALPDGAVVLAGNAFSGVQALAVTHDKGTFHAVQYHPEYNCLEVGRLAIARQADLLGRPPYATPDDVLHFKNDMQHLTDDPGRRDLAEKWGISPDLQDIDKRQTEVKNWLAYITRQNP